MWMDWGLCVCGWIGCCVYVDGLGVGVYVVGLGVGVYVDGLGVVYMCCDRFDSDFVVGMLPTYPHQECTPRVAVWAFKMWQFSGNGKLCYHPC